jgi:hypothetical protein
LYVQQKVQTFELLEENFQTLPLFCQIIWIEFWNNFFETVAVINANIVGGHHTNKEWTAALWNTETSTSQHSILICDLNNLCTSICYGSHWTACPFLSIQCCINSSQAESVLCWQLFKVNLSNRCVFTPFFVFLLIFDIFFVYWLHFWLFSPLSRFCSTQLYGR